MVGNLKKKQKNNNKQTNKKYKNDVFQRHRDLLKLVDWYKINNIYMPYFLERAHPSNKHPLRIRASPRRGNLK